MPTNEECAEQLADAIRRIEQLELHAQHERAELDRCRRIIADVEALCLDMQAPSANGGMTDIDAIWPSAVLTVLRGGSA